MEHRISASELARRLGDVLGRVHYRGDAFLVERHHVPIARITPVTGAARPTLRDAMAAWMDAGEPDPPGARSPRPLVAGLLGLVGAPLGVADPDLPGVICGSAERRSPLQAERAAHAGRSRGAAEVDRNSE